MPNIICNYCNKQFYNKHSTAMYCNNTCYLSHRKYLSEAKKSFYAKHKESYADKIISYPSAPTGKAYIGIAKTPLMPNDNNIGYKGVILQDENRTLIQCSLCGVWRKIIGDSHIKKCGGMTSKEYKEKFGILSSTGLVSDETSLNYTKSAIKNKKGSQHFIKNVVKFSKKGVKNNRHIKFSESMEWKNRHGSCYEQLRTRLYEFIRVNHEFPNAHNRGQSLYKQLIKNFSSLGRAMKEYGLPHFIRKGSSYIFTYPDNTIYRYNINKIDEREILYKQVMNKCISLIKNHATK